MNNDNIIHYLLLIVVLFMMVSVVEKSNFITSPRTCSGKYSLGSYDAGSHSYADSITRRP